MLLTITGPSASGKTSLARALKTMVPNVSMLRSVTTRKKRESDLPDEYRYVSEKEFESLVSEGAFLWTVEAHGHHYGTLVSDIDATGDDGVSIGILKITAVADLRAYFAKRGALGQIIPIYLDIADEPMLRARLKKRGDTLEDIEIRIKECRSWAAERDASGVPFITLDGTKDSETLALTVSELIKQRKGQHLAHQKTEAAI